MNIVKLYLAVSWIAMLGGCQKTEVTGISGAQSVDYFAKNPEIAKTIANKCIDYEKKEYSKLTAAAQKEWQDSTDGINCRNSKQAASWIVITERQRRQSEASRKYAVDAAK